MALERSVIVAAALDVLDETGLDGLTMRRVAEALHVQAPSLYWHFPGKPALLEAMANALLEDVARSPDQPDDFRGVLRRSAHELRGALRTRRDGARVYAGTLAIGENALRLAQTVIAALDAGGFDPQTSARGGFSLLSYVLGFVIEEQMRQGTGSGPVALAAQLVQWTGRYPALEAVLPHLSGGEDDARFAFGVNLILAGLSGHRSSEADLAAAFVRAFKASR